MDLKLFLYYYFLSDCRYLIHPYRIPSIFAEKDLVLIESLSHFNQKRTNMTDYNVERAMI